MTFGSLFAGIGGFDLGLERAGMECRWQVEIDGFCNRVLEKHWPHVTRYRDVREVGKHNLEPVDLICGGDPCPCRSKAKSRWGSKSADLSGYFLAVVAGLRPRWVVRENVLASDDVYFLAALEAIGYRTISIRTNAHKVTAQNRQRDFIVGSTVPDWIGLLPVSAFQQGYKGFDYKISATGNTCFCLTTHAYRYDSRDNYLWEGGGLRVLDCEERQRLSGFPNGWLAGLSKTRVAKMTGNTCVPQIVEIIGRAIIKADNNRRGGGRVAISKKIRFEAFKRDGFQCAYCGKSPKYK